MINKVDQLVFCKILSVSNLSGSVYREAYHEELMEYIICSWPVERKYNCACLGTGRFKRFF